jgi:hypothetical protein
MASPRRNLPCRSCCLVDEILAQLPALYFLMVSHFILHTSMNSKKPPKQTRQTRYSNGIAPGFASVVNAFVQDKQVTRDEGKGFASGALKVNGKIFAMMTSQRKLFRLAMSSISRSRLRATAEVNKSFALAERAT